RKRI
ncbi:preprotein translocase, SecY subunit, partial [Vibrio harveyi]